jgi:hypothetical protein
MAERVLFYLTQSGAREDKWWLLIEDDGRTLVEHEWKDGDGMHVEDAIEAAAFLSGVHDARAQEELRTFEAGRSKRQK